MFDAYKRAAKKAGPEGLKIKKMAQERKLARERIKDPQGGGKDAQPGQPVVKPKP